LVGFFQLLLVMGGMTAYFINYGALLHLPVIPTFNMLRYVLIVCSAKGYMDGPISMSIHLPSSFVYQHVLLPRISKMASIPGPVGQGGRDTIRCPPAPPRPFVPTTRTLGVTDTA
jgi:hypothetical protein